MTTSFQQRRRLGRRYLYAYGWITLGVNCVLLFLLARRYYAGTLDANVFRYAAGMLASFAFSIVLILVAKSK
jgi:hypothetical protein